MKRRRWGPLELVDDNGFTGPIRAGYVDQGFYAATCLCRTVIVFDAKTPAAVCERCNRKYKVQPAKVG